MSLNVYPLLSQPIIQITFTNADNVAEDPDTGHLEIEAPDGTITVVQLADAAHPATGVYETTIVADQAGRWRYKGVASQPFRAATLDAVFLVPASVFPT